MKIVIHGVDIVASRKLLDDQKRESPQAEIIQMEGKQITLTDMVTAVETKSLFGSSRMIIIENLVSGVFNADKEAILNYLSLVATDNTIIIWESSEIPKKYISPFFSTWKVYNLPYPQILFKFLDMIGTTSAGSILSIFHSLITQKDASVIHTMLVRQFRLLIIAKDTGAEGLSDMQSWQIHKFLQQSKYFSRLELTNDYRELLSIEYKVKSGKTPYSLSQLLDIFLLTL